MRMRPVGDLADAGYVSGAAAEDEPVARLPDAGLTASGARRYSQFAAAVAARLPESHASAASMVLSVLLRCAGSSRLARAPDGGAGHHRASRAPRRQARHLGGQVRADKAGACAACHGLDGNGLQQSAPRIAGMPERYIAQQLALFKHGERTSGLAAMMVPFAMPLSAQDMRDLGAWYASQHAGAGVADDTVITTGPNQGRKFYQVGERLYRAGDGARDIPACMSCHGPAGGGNPGRPIRGGWPGRGVRGPAPGGIPHRHHHCPRRRPFQPDGARGQAAH